MSPDLSTASAWAGKALAHARHLARTPRGSTTEAEAQAAGERQQLAALGALRRRPALPGLALIWLFMALVLRCWGTPLLAAARR
jgi:hypothetical protein